MAVSAWILPLSPPASGHLCNISVAAWRRLSSIRRRSRRYSPAAVFEVFTFGAPAVVMGGALDLDIAISGYESVGIGGCGCGSGDDDWFM